MRLSVKLSLFTTVGIVLVLGCDGYLRLRREMRWFEDQQRRDHRVLGHVLSLAASAALDRAGHKRAIQMLRDVNLREDNVEIRWQPDPLRTLRKTTHELHENRWGEPRTLVTRRPLQLGQPGQLILTQSLSREDQYLSNTAYSAFRVTAILVVLSAAIIFAVGWWLLGVPLHALVAGARRIGAGELDTRLRLPHRDEIGELAREMNTMCEQLTASRTQAIEQATRRANALDRMARAERWTTLGKLVSGLSQDLASRARELGARANLLLAQSDRPDAQQDLQFIADRAEQLGDALVKAGAYAGAAGEVTQVHDLNVIARTAAELVGHATRDRDLSITVAGDETPVWVIGRSSQLQQLAVNLLLNAVQAVSDGGQVRIEARRDCRPFLRDGVKIGSSTFTCLVIEDDGAGMTQQVQTRIFEPMFTTREAPQFIGLGLTAVAAIVEAHRGFVDVTSGPDLGTRVSVFLQSAEGSADF